MSVNLFLKRRLVLDSKIWDLVDGVYSVFRPDMSTLWTNAVIKIRRTSDAATAFIFFDGSLAGDTWSLSSLISTTSNTTPDSSPSVTLGTFLGATGGFVSEQYFIQPSNTIDNNKTAVNATSGLQPQSFAFGTILTKNGFPNIDYLGARNLDAVANSILDTGNTFTIITVSYSTSSADVQSVLSTRGDNNASQSRLVLNNDRRSNALSFRLRNTSSVNHDANYLATESSTDQRVTTVLVTPTEITTYLNNVFQETVSWTGTYSNLTLRLGKQLLTGSPLSGGIQLAAIISGDSPNKTEYFTNIDSILSIP